MIDSLEFHRASVSFRFIPDNVRTIPLKIDRESVNRD